MKLKLHLAFILCFLSCLAQAQIYVNGDTLMGNEWIHYNQQYIKIPVSADGFYRIGYNELAAAVTASGASLSSITGDNFSMVHNGDEQAIFVSSSGVLGTNDYILFYGKKNRGELEKYFYAVDEYQTSPYKSVINDTSAYFITWDNQSNHRRINSITNDLSNPPTAEPWYWQVDNYSYPGFQFGASYTAEQLYYSRFDHGEGFSSGFMSTNTTTFYPTDFVNNGPDCQVQTRIITNSVGHQISVTVAGAGAPVTPVNQVVYGYSTQTYNFSFVASHMMTPVRITANATAGASDQLAVSYVTLSYPRHFNANNLPAFHFWVSHSNQAKYIVINSFSPGSGTAYLFDVATGLRIQAFPDNGQMKILLPASPTPNSADLRELFLVSDATYLPSPPLSPIQFTNLNNINADYLIVSHSSLMTNGSQHPVQDYANYRYSTGYRPAVFDIEELYNQFAWGIRRQPLAIRHLAAYARKHWQDPRYVFLIGKGRGYTDGLITPTLDLLVPTFGHPASDVLLVSPRNSDIAYIPVGRLAAKTPQEVTDYLQKVQALEAQQSLPQTIVNKKWMKNVLHLGGGDPGIEVTTIHQYLENMKNIIEGVRYGGHVTSYYKNSTDPIQVSTSESLDSLINGGVSLITFFGHSSPNSFDFNLDRPENYHNAGRNPLMISLGCFAGNIHLSGQSISERFVFIPQQGAVGFMASTGLSTIYALNNFANTFYQKLSTNLYGQGIGKIMQDVNRLYDASAVADLRCAIEQMTLHGDPALVLNTHPTPDYAVDDKSYKVLDPIITTRMDSFGLQLTVSNIGMAIDTAFNIEIIRTLPNGTQVAAIPVKRIKAPYYQSSLHFKIPVLGDQALGVNTFRIRIDKDNEVTELPSPSAEQNNEVSFSLYISSQDIIPVWPPDFSIEPNAVKLSASTGNAFASPLAYVMQIDTTARFNSPVKKQLNIIQAGGVVDWTPNILWHDSTVYYWRVGIDSVSPQLPYNWRTRSFVYLPASSRGWNQSHYYQYLADTYHNMEVRASRKFEFVSNVQNISLESGYSNVVDVTRFNTYLNNAQRITGLSGSCPNENGFYVVVLDSLSLNAWQNPSHGTLYGSLGCNTFANGGFFYPTDNPTYRFNLINFLQTTIPDKDYVLLYSVNNLHAEQWSNDQLNYGASIFSILSAQGATRINQTATNHAPYCFFYKKNDPTYTPHEVLKDSVSQALDASFPILGNWKEGYVQSTVIGPASSWSSLHWRTSRYDNFDTDTFHLKLYGINAAGTETLLSNAMVVADTSLAGYSAQQYPYMRVEFDAKDVIHNSARQLRYWRVNYRGLPEAALRPEMYLSFQRDSLNQGDPVKLAIAAQNISPYPMDSMLVKFSIVGHADKTILRRLKPLSPGDTLVARVMFDSRDLSGAQQLVVEINPNNDQPEAYHFNNIGLRSFYVVGDHVNPIMDVTFDGQHILNNDIVSANPDIVITLKDENRYLALNDTSDMQIYIEYPSSGLRRISFNDPILQFFPADPASAASGHNKAQVIMHPSLLQDGDYALVVSARDRSGNVSGAISYRVRFRVINKAMISNLFNYPNPFTTSTRFVFTLTGTSVPEQMKIQILTVSGRIVREITESELGPLHIGNNITTYAWDGTDEFGDRLANGVYLYRVLTRSHGKDYDKYDTNTDQYFQGGYGKMVLFR